MSSDDIGVQVKWIPYTDLPGRAEICSPDEAVELFRRVDADLSHGRVLIDFVHGNGAELTVGAGAPWSVLCFQRDLDPPYYRTLAMVEPPAEDVDFSYGGSFSEFPAHSFIPKADAESAIREFCVTGIRPTKVAWEEV